jgi:PAS domain S-box-containing protein
MQDHHRYTAFELVPDAIVVVGDDGCIVAVNAQAESMFGYPRGELVGRPVDLLLPGRLRAAHRGHRVAYRADPQRRRMGTGLALWGCRSDGSEFPVDISLSPVEGDDETVVVAAIRDMTDQKRAEAARARLAAIDETSDDAISAKDLAGTILSWNEGAERIYGYPAAEVIGRPISVLVPPGRDEEISTLLGAIAQGERIDHFETVRRRKDGSLIDASVTISPIRSPDGSIIGASTIARDVTERRRLEALRSGFIANAAHELRTPLATLTGLAELLSAHWPEMPPEQIQDCLEVLHRQGERAGLLIANLLDLADLERGTAGMRAERVAVAKVVSAVVASLAPPENTTVTSGVDPGLHVIGDPVRLQQILTHLVTNAYRYGGPDVGIHAARQRGRVLIAVSDDGPGIPADAVDALFEPFTRAEARSHPLGSGIGLAVCRRLAEAMGGDIRYEPGRPTGARFLLALPAAG